MCNIKYEELNDPEIKEKDYKKIILKIMKNHKKRTIKKMILTNIPDVKWEDIGGLDKVKKIIRDIIETPIKHK